MNSAQDGCDCTHVKGYKKHDDETNDDGKCKTDNVGYENVNCKEGHSIRISMRNACTANMITAK